MSLKYMMNPVLYYYLRAIKRFFKNLETYQDPKVSWQIYRVKNGENINEIAARHSTTIKQLKTINGIARNKNITLGQKILVPHTVTENQADNIAHKKNSYKIIIQMFT